jgi:transketolase
MAKIGVVKNLKKKENRSVKEFIAHKAYGMRRSILVQTTAARSGHPTSALSAVDMVATLFFYALRFKPEDPAYKNNDRFILSKGHASPVLYAVYKELGLISEDELLTYRSFNSVLEGHPTPRFRYTEAATGSLGQGLSIGVGMALNARMDALAYKTYVLMGDSEIAEGSVWEAAELAAFNHLDNLIAMVDVNRLGQANETMHAYHLERYAAKFKAFGWHVLEVDGHNIPELMYAYDKAREHTGSPVVILAKTIKGYGIARVENKPGFHGKPFTQAELPACLQELQERFEPKPYQSNYVWQPHMPEAVAQNKAVKPFECTYPHYAMGEPVATRKAYGQALVALGHSLADVVALDAEVKNSTYAELFADVFPQRFVEAFIAEQNMIGMAVGLQRRGKVPFASTFASFVSRAYDQLRMAAIGQAAVRVVGSHAGVSIGQDGPSQMGLEDIAMMRTLLGAAILYPADAVSTWHLVYQMAEYNQGISYLRTTRMELPVIYAADTEFIIGGCKVLKSSPQDVALIVAAGITLHEALNAYNRLLNEGIYVAVIDLYSIYPMDVKTLRASADKAGKRIITVEDHYLAGGLGEAVTMALQGTDYHICSLAVTKMPRSGLPYELLAYEGIDATAIVTAVKQRV